MVEASNAAPDSRNGAGSSFANFPNNRNAYSASQAFDGTLSSDTVGMTGSGYPMDNMKPYLALNWCIALQGEFPQTP